MVDTMGMTRAAYVRMMLANNPTCSICGASMQIVGGKGPVLKLGCSTTVHIIPPGVLQIFRDHLHPTNDGVIIWSSAQDSASFDGE